MEGGKTWVVLAALTLAASAGVAITNLCATQTNADPSPSHTWIFSDPYGNPTKIYRYDEPPAYGFSPVPDLLERSHECSESGYRLCFVSRQLAVAIPEKPPQQGTSWSAQGATFSAVKIVKGLSVLGVGIEDVYVIQGRVELRDAYAQLTRCSTILFSYKEGLIGFTRAPTCEEEERFYFAAEIPSLGAGR